MANPAKLVGAGSVRLATVVLAVATAALVARRGEWAPYGTYASIAAGFLTFIGLIHSVHAFYRRWMAFAEALHAVVIAVTFGLAYLIVVPLFSTIVWYRDPLKLRRRSRESTWVRRSPDVDTHSFERMG